MKWEKCFPNGFEEHLKKLVYEYNEKFINYNEGGLLWNPIQESHVKSIAQQMRCFGWSEFKRPVEWDDPRLVAEKPDCELQQNIHSIMTDRDHMRQIMKKNMMVGVVLEGIVGYYNSCENHYYFKENDYILPYCGYVYSSTSDNNGAGYKEHDWYKYLVCLPYNHNLW